MDPEIMVNDDIIETTVEIGETTSKGTNWLMCGLIGVAGGLTAHFVIRPLIDKIVTKRRLRRSNNDLSVDYDLNS
jgi:hypothetical protein